VLNVAIDNQNFNFFLQILFT